MKKKKIRIDDKLVEIVVSIDDEEIEDNRDLFDLEATMDLSEVISNE